MGVNRKKIDHMVDIETYSQLTTAAIATIGGCKFDISTGEIWDEFYVTINPKSCKDLGLHFQKETMDWWMEQSPEARKALRENNVDISTAFDLLDAWFEPKGNFVCWGMFDMPVLDYAYYQLGRKSKWNWWNSTDLRTIANLYDAKIDRSGSVHHNAKDDAVMQAEFAIKLFNPDVKIHRGLIV